MVARVAGRLATLVVSLFVASLVVFWTLNLLPGDLAQTMLGVNADPASVAELRTRLGLDRPPLERYLTWLWGLVRFDLGRSGFTGEPVAQVMAGPFAITLWLVVLATVVSLLLAVPAGLWSAHRARHWDGFAVNATSQIGMALPAFLAGIGLVVVFAVKLRWLPANGYVSLQRDPVEWARHLVLPVLSLGVVQGAVLTRYVRSAFVELAGADHIRTARAIGWGRLGALWRHGRREAGLSVITVLGLQIAALFTGAIVIENVFVLPGVGTMLLNAVNARDLMVVQSLVMVLVAVVLAVMAVVDIVHGLLDPRVRTGAS